jgi:hypothetical protein
MACDSGGLPPTIAIKRSPSITGVLPTPKKFWMTPNSLFVSTCHSFWPSSARQQTKTPSTPKAYTRFPSTTGEQRGPLL